MRKLLYIAITLLSFSNICLADGTWFASALTELDDTPNSYSGESGKCVTVKGTEDGVEFAACSGAAGDSISIDSVAVVDPDFQDTAEINVTDTSNVVTFDIKASSIDETKLDASTNASLDLADSALQAEANDLSAAVTWANVPDANVDGSAERDEVCGTTDLSSSCEINANVVDFADIKYDNTLAGNPALAVDECFFMSTTTGGGFVCEGSTADTSEQFYKFPDVNDADITDEIALIADAQILTNKTINTASNTITVVEADISDLSHTVDTTLNLAGVETITGNWVNTANPWADNEVANNLTVDDAGIAATITRDTEWDTFAEINAASTDTDAVLDTDIGSTVQAWDAELDTLSGLAETTGNVIISVASAWASVAQPAIDCTNCTNTPDQTVNTADIADVSVTQTELAELETIGTTTISANQWAALGGIAETLTSTELNLLDGITVLSGSNTGDDDVPESGDFGNATDLDASGAISCTDCLNATEIEDIYLLNNGDAGTGVFDFGGATSLEIPNSTVSGLPIAGTAGRLAVVTDGTDSEDCSLGLGSSYVLCSDNGVSWVPTGSETNSLETTITGIEDTEIFIGNLSNSGTFASISGDATLANTGALTVSDLTCTDCINATEIEDIYLLNSGDSATGDYTFDTTTLHIDSVSNEVGIGTASPSTKLHIYENDASSTAQIKIEQDGLGDSSLVFNITAAQNWQIGVDNDDSDKFKIDSNTIFSDGAQLTIDTSGKFGLGDSTPAARLDVGGGTATSIDGTDDLLVKDDIEVDGDAYFEGGVTCTDCIAHSDILDSDQSDTKCLRLFDPTADDDLQSVWANKTANDFLITEIWGESDQTVNFDLQVDDGTPADVNGTDISPAAGEAEDTTLSGDTTLAAGEELDLVVTSVSGTPTWVTICWTGNWVD